MVVVVFRSRIKPGSEAALEALGTRMYELGTKMPGFVSYKEYAAADGETVAIVEFDTHEHLAAWRMHPEHRAAQERGRAELFESYRIQVCDVVRESEL